MATNLEAHAVGGKRRPDSGFALIMAILALVLLTFLGLTMAVTTSTEQHISSNFRLSQQAYYNAEGCMAVAKVLLRDVDWKTVLPTARAGSWTYPGSTATAPTAKYTRNDEWGNPSRNFENATCDDLNGHEGYGAVLDDGGAVLADAPFQYKNVLLGIGVVGQAGLESARGINGTCTIWVRRGLKAIDNATFQDDPTDDFVAVTAEGTAPSLGGLRSSFTRSRDSVRVVEAQLSRTSSGGTPCGVRGGQTSQGPEGAGFGCTPVTAEGVGDALGVGGLTDLGAK